jgi:hypothetical protein
VVERIHASRLAQPDLIVTGGRQPGHRPKLPASRGTGKTQLAARFVGALRDAGTVDVLVRVTAASREAVVLRFRAGGGRGGGSAG